MISIIILLIFLITYVPCVLLLWNNTKVEDSDGRGSRILMNLLIFGPGINVLMSIIFLVLSSIDNFPIFKRFVLRMIQRRKFRKERERKIKLGIIKITPEDPYGEEDWTN